jgi:hypothetical protein
MNMLELLTAIKAEVDELYKFLDDRDKLIEQIEEAVAEVQKSAERESDWELMNKGTTITHKITHVLNTSLDDREVLRKAVVEIFKESANGGIDENDKNIERLEQMLAKARFSNALASTLHNTLATILEEAKALKEKK